MSKVGSMTVGLVLIFMGAQLYLVKSYLMTPTATRFVSDYFNSNNGSQFANPNLQGVYGNAATGGSNFSTLGNSNAGGFSNSAFGANVNSAGTQGQLGRHPGQSWPYYPAAGSQGFGGSLANGNRPAGNVFQNSSYGTNSARSLAPQNVIAADGLARRRFMPPKWIMWPVLFFGVVCFLHGLALRG